jgi:D-alanine-D-alanine ligase
VDQTTGRPTLIEINSVPGLGPASIVPQQVLAGGRTLTDFFTLLLHETLSDAQNRTFSRVL